METKRGLWRGVVAVVMAAAGMASFIMALLAGAFVMAQKDE